MEFREQVIYQIQECLFKNDVRCGKKTSIRLSHVVDNYFCIITKNNDYNFFSKKSPNELNNFYSSIYQLLFSENFGGMGCFDYERVPIPESQVIKTNNIMNTVNTYFSGCLNLILVEYNDLQQSIKPMAFFTYKDNFIWNVCTGIDYRNQGIMTMLLKHFFQLYKTKKLNYLKLDLNNQGLSLVLLKKNPEFKSVKKFYEENGFKVEQRKSDRLIMKLLSS